MVSALIGDLSSVLRAPRAKKLQAVGCWGSFPYLEKVHLVKAMVFPVVMYGCESWTVLIQLSSMCVWEAKTFLPLGVMLNGLGETVSQRLSLRQLGI